MKFDGNVKANYEGSRLFAQKRLFKFKSFLIISENVKINDIKDQYLLINLLWYKKTKLNIASFNDGKINANVKLKWKRFRILQFKKDKPIFEVRDVSKSFDGRPILKKLFPVFPGECRYFGS